jgi:ankyrin repeat protein
MRRIIAFRFILSCFGPVLGISSRDFAIPEARAEGLIVFDELGRVLNRDEAFYLTNPPPPGQARQPIAAVDAYDDFGETPLIKAVQMGDRDAVIKLLDNKADPNLFSASRLSALAAAADSEDLEMVRLLLKRGARADLGYPLRGVKNPEILALLKQHGARESEPPRSRHIAVDDPRQVEALRSALAEEERSGEMNLPFALAVISDCTQAQLEALLKAGADINQLHPNFGTAISRSIHRRQDSSLVLFLLEAGADPNLSGSFGYPLLEAVIVQRVDLVELLLRFGARADIKNEFDGNTALHYAALNNNAEIGELLIKAGADVNAVNADKETPLHYAANENSLALAELLLKAGAKTDVLDQNELTPLYYAVTQEESALAELLLKAGAKVNVQEKGRATYLHYAARVEDLILAEGLIKAGAQVNALDEDDSTPLHYAIRNEDRKMVKLLLEAGAKVTIQDKAGYTALDYARSMWGDAWIKTHVEAAKPWWHFW